MIAPEHRQDYIDSLKALTVGGDPLAYRQLMGERLEASLDHHLMVLKRGLDQAPKPS